MFQMVKITNNPLTELNEHLLLACENADIPMARSLIQKGASPDAKNTVGETALHLAVKSGNLWMVNYVIQDLLANVNAPDAYGRTPLHWAAQKGNLYMVESLILGGANIEAEDEKALTVRTYAEREGHHDIVKLLGIVNRARG